MPILLKFKVCCYYSVAMFLNIKKNKSKINNWEKNKGVKHLKIYSSVNEA